MVKKKEKTKMAVIKGYITQTEESEHNRLVFKEMVRKMRPDIFVLMDILDNTGVNPMVVFKFIRQIKNLAEGAQWGSVEAIMEKGIVRSIRGIDHDKLNEPALLEKK